MKKLIPFLSVLFILSSFDLQNGPDFTLTGTTHGLPDGTILLLRYKEAVIDSAAVEDNSFRFQTSLDQYPAQVVLHKKDFSEYRFLWIENKAMTFDASTTDFRHAIVTGSETENLSQELMGRIDTVSRRDKMKLEKEFVAEHPNSIVSAYILAVYSTTWGKDTSQKLYGAFSPEIKETEYGQRIANYIRLNKNPRIGDPFVDFEMETAEGNTAKLSDFKGKVVLLEFWASGCGPCRIENPNLVKTFQTYHPKGFEIFAVSQDTKKEYWLNAIEKDGLPWLQASDLKGQGNLAALIYGIRGIPDNFLIDRKGTIIGRNLRGEALNQKLNELPSLK